MRLYVFTFVSLVVLSACKAKPPPVADASPVAAKSSDDPRIPLDMAPPSEEEPDLQALANMDGGVKVDEAFFVKFLAAMGDQIEHDAKAAAKRKYKSRDEAIATLESLTPAGLHLSPETAAKVGLTDSDTVTLAPRLALFAQGHEDIVERESKKLSARLEPRLREVLAAVQKQFPDGGFEAPGPPDDPHAR